MPTVVRVLPPLVVVLGGLLAWHLRDEPSPESLTIRRGADGEEVSSPAARLEGQCVTVPGAGEAAVTDGADEEPVAGRVHVKTLRHGTAGVIPGILVVCVEASGRRHAGRTGAGGELTFEDLARGKARFEVVARGWVAEAHEDVEVSEEPQTIVLSLQRAVALRGRVVSAIDDQPVAGARVVAAGQLTVGSETSRKRGDVWDVVATNPDGGFLLAAVPLDDEIVFTVLAEGFAREVREVVIPSADAAAPELLFRLHPGGAVRGKVVDRSGRRIEGARVFVFPDGDEHLREFPAGAWSDSVRTVASHRARTDADGRFVVNGLSLGGRYAATAFARGHVRAEDASGLVLSADDVGVAITLVVRTPATIEVVARDAEGRAVVGARAVIGDYSHGMGPNDAEGVTDAEGRVELGRLRPGTHDIKIEADALTPFAQRVELGEGETRRIEARLVHGAIISGLVVDLAGRPLADVHVQVYDHVGNPLQRKTVKTGKDGRFAFRGLERVPHAVTAWREWLEIEGIKGLIPPVDDVRLVGNPLGVVRARLVLPPATPTPEHILVGSRGASGGGGGYQAWTNESVEWYVGAEERTLYLEGEGFAPWVLSVRVAPGENRDLGEIHLSAGVDLAGRVTSRDGKPVVGATLEAVHHSFRTTRTDTKGRFALEGLRPGRQEIVIRAPDFLVRVLELSREVSDLELRVVLEEGVALRVHVLDAEDRPVTGVDVSVERTDTREWEASEEFENWMAWDETDEQGRIRARLAPGTYRIRVGDEDDPLAESEVTLREREVEEAVLRVR